MSRRSAVLDEPVLLTLAPDEGFFVAVNCLKCGAGLTVEGGSRGREDMPAPCANVKQSLACPECKSRFLFTADLLVIAERRSPEKRWTS